MFLAIAVLAVVPVTSVLHHWSSTTRDIVYWDEIDSVLPFLLQLKQGMHPERFVVAVMGVTNEHRTATSRLIYALSYWATGTVDFVWIGAIGNAFIVVACGLLVWVARTIERRLQLAAVLGFMVFHLGNYENFLWSGSSIDHFQVIALAVAALVALVRQGVWAFRIATLCALLASFTLAHGLVVWPIGALILARERRCPELVSWGAVAAITLLVFLAGFEWNAGHHIGTSGAAMARLVVIYWFEILGAPLAFGHASLAIALGAVLVLAVTLRLVWGEWTQVRVLMPVVCFLVGAALLIAFGRAEFTHGHVFSRYLVVGGLAWALMLFEAMNLGRWRVRPLVTLGCVAPLLIGFNYAQNVHSRSDAATFVEHRDRAALRYQQFGEDGHAPVTLHPVPAHATRLLAAAEQAGVYRMPQLCVERKFPQVRPSDRISYFVDEFELNARAVYLSGWVGVRDQAMRRGAIHVVLRSPERTVTLTTVAGRRPDVVSAYHNSGWEWSGFQFAIPRERLPQAEYQIGFVVGEDKPEIVMTAHRLDLRGEGKAVLAGRD